MLATGTDWRQLCTSTSRFACSPQPTLHITNMGWFSSSADEGGVKKTSGGAFETPSRSNRKQCYAARDAFFECLDKNNILDSINTKNGREKAASSCGQLDKEFEKNCAHTWVRGTAFSADRSALRADMRALSRSICNSTALKLR